MLFAFWGGSLHILKSLLFMFEKYNYTFLGAYLYLFRCNGDIAPDNLKEVKHLALLYLVLGIALTVLGLP